ncbi:Dehydrodolichyl diphosphate synthase 2 [Bienertia sinuspersici]
MQTLVSLNYSRFSYLVSSPKSLVVPRSNSNPILLKNHPIHINLRNNCSNYFAPTITCAQNGDEKFDSKKEEEYYTKIVFQPEGSTIPKHIAISLDGNRRWLKLHGLDLDYRPFFQAHMRFIDYCLKWKVTTATNYIYRIGNMLLRSEKANDLIMGQFERFLEEGLEKFKRLGVKVSVVGEEWMLTQSCQASIKKVEEATKNNTNLDLMILMCYTSQKDIVDATKKICKQVKEGKMELEDVNEDLFGQQLSICGSRPPVDLMIRTGGQVRIGMFLGWEVPHVELYFTDTNAPDFGEDLFNDALKSFQQRGRWFGK